MEHGAPEFFRELHLKFYPELPAGMRGVTDAKGEKEPLAPGAFRDRDVTVGAHLSPPFALVPALMAHFQLRYQESGISRARKIIAIGASHHRAAWIHPEAERVVLLLREALYRGEIKRGEAGRIVGASERTGRTALGAALGAGLLKSDSPKSAVRLALPAKVLSTYFPLLFPAGSIGPASGG